MKALALSLGLIFASTALHAADPAEGTAHDVKRAAKKVMHKAQEAVCAEGDAKCAAKKLKHRAEEGSDYVGDKVKENSK